jgi:hypothetical protein
MVPVPALLSCAYPENAVESKISKKEIFLIIFG